MKGIYKDLEIIMPEEIKRIESHKFKTQPIIKGLRQNGASKIVESISVIWSHRG